MQRYDIIQHLIEKHGFTSYLEIGVLNRATLDHVNVPLKHGVDPNGCGDFTMTSDEFFEQRRDQTYDLIFIDGLHLYEQAKKDIENALTLLNENGIIVVHDCLPTEEWHQLRTGLPGKPWTGDVWKAFAELRYARLDLDMTVVDTDWGCGLVKKRRSLREPVEYLVPLTWPQFQRNRNELMNVITVEEFLNGHS